MLLTVQEDITERRRMEDALRESEQKYRALVDNVGVGVSIISPNMEILFLNKQFDRWFPDIDASKKPICYKAFNKPPRENICSYCPTCKTLKDGQVHEAITETPAGDKIMNYRIISSPVEDKDGKVIAAIETVEDITAQKKAEEAEKELNNYREKMIRAEQLASLGALGTTLAHELTQPLTVLTLTIENALTKLNTVSCPATVTKKLKDSLAEVSNITSIVKRFRSYVRKSSEGIAEEIKLKMVAERTVRMLSEGARRARVTLRLEGIDKLPPAYLNEKDVEQVFFALIENAIEAADGKEDRKVVIRGDVKGGHIELQFSDNCGGIAPENLGRIFEPFFTTKPAGESTGLGLCIVEHVVSRVGGKVRVESKAGKGSTFFVTLPISSGEKS